MHHSVDKIKNSICGHKCGYILSNPQVFNPLNYIFIQTSKVYPIDYIFMIILILYFFIATVVGIIFVGIRFLWLAHPITRPTNPTGLTYTNSAERALSRKVSSWAQSFSCSLCSH